MPTQPFQDQAGKIGGGQLVTLYELTVTAPTTKTWYLAAQDLDADAIYSGSPAYQGLVLPETTPVDVMSAIGGQGRAGSFTLVLRDTLGTYRGGGPRRRFSEGRAAVHPLRLRGGRVSRPLAAPGA